MVSVEHFEGALSICPDGHHCHAIALCNLAMAHFINCRIDHGPMELSTSISHYRKALELRHVGHPDRPRTLLHLAEVLLYHYGKFGFEEFPGEIIRLASEVQASYSESVGSHERRAADLTLQTHALYKVINSGSLDDNNKLIPTLRQAAEDIPHDYFDKPQRLINLSLALRIRYEFCGHRGDLDGSIATHEEAMRLSPYALDSPTHTQFLKEWAKQHWGVARGRMSSLPLPVLVSTFSLICLPGLTLLEFVVPRFTIYRIIYEYLEKIGRITDASECFHQMVDELVGQANAHDEQVHWVLGEWPCMPYGCMLNFKGRYSGKLEGLGDTAMSAERYDVAVSEYSVALSLNPATPQCLFIKRSKAYIARGLWQDALNDADKVHSFVAQASS